MRLSSSHIQPLVHDFLAVLDEQIVLEEATVNHLKGLSEAILSRDDNGVQRLMDDAADTQERFSAVEARRRAAGRNLAQALHWTSEDTTLTRLVAEMPESELRQAVDERRRRLMGLVDEVRRQHLRTATILIESARINRAFLEALFPQTEGVKTYGSGGTSANHPGAGLVDARS